MAGHVSRETRSDGSLILCWVRRARGAWGWPDGVDLPLVEQAESYVVTLGPTAAPVAQWLVGQSSLEIDAATAAALRTQAPSAPFAVAQRGDAGVSIPLPLGLLS